MGTIVQLHRTFFALLFALAMATETVTASEQVVTRVPIRGTIDHGLVPLVNRAVETARENHSDLILFDINTLGGAMDAMIEIRDAIDACKTRSVAFINPRAISAGALIALACDSIYMAPGGSFGAATPVTGGGEKASEKVVSYGRTEFRSTAERHQRNAEIATAMVDEDVEIEGLIEKGKLLTLTTTQALQWRMVEGERNDVDAVLAALDLSGSQVVTIEENWAEQIIRFLNNPFVTGILLAVAFWGIIGEIQTAGWGVPGTSALVALIVFFGSKYLVGLVGLEEVLLIAGGIVLIALEILVIPGFGVTGILGGLALMTGLAMSMLGRLPSVSDVTQVVFVMLGAVGLSLLGVILLFRYVERSPAWKRIGLQASQKKHQGFVSSDRKEERIGMTGLALTPLRPSGTGLFDGVRFDVVSEGDFIEANAPIEILKDEGYRVIVRKRENNPAPSKTA